MNCLKWGEVEEVVGGLEAASIGLPVFDEEISANTSRSSTTTWDFNSAQIEESCLPHLSDQRAS